VLVDILSNIRIWIVAGVLLALSIGSLGSLSPYVIIVVLMIQMTLSMEGLSFKQQDIKKDRTPILVSVLFCFGVNTVVTLAVGAIFINQYPDIWNGWVVLAAVPCAVSVITAALYLNGNIKMSVLSSAVIYLLALIVTPLITLIFAGKATDPLRILLYVFLFVAVPMLMTIPMKKVQINRHVKIITINAMMFLLVLLSLGYNRDYIFEDPMMVLLITLGCVVRVFVVGFLLVLLMRRKGVKRSDGVVYVSMAVWKNSGLAVTLCMILFIDSSIAVIPCVISLLIELLWFAIMTGYEKKIWSEDNINACDG
jgi:Arsenite efflux pump ACR3 and related permeases